MSVSSACHVDQMILQVLNEIIWGLNVTVINLRSLFISKLGFSNSAVAKRDRASFQYRKKDFMNIRNTISIAKKRTNKC